MGEFFGVDAVVLILAAVDGAEVEGVGEDEGEAGVLAGIGQPIPAEHAFSADGEAVARRGHKFEEVGEVVVLDVAVNQFFALTVHEADVHWWGAGRFRSCIRL